VNYLVRSNLHDNRISNYVCFFYSLILRLCKNIFWKCKSLCIQNFKTLLFKEVGSSLLFHFIKYFLDFFSVSFKFCYVSFWCFNPFNKSKHCLECTNRSLCVCIIWNVTICKNFSICYTFI